MTDAYPGGACSVLTLLLLPSQVHHRLTTGASLKGCPGGGYGAGAPIRMTGEREATQHSALRTQHSSHSALKPCNSSSIAEMTAGPCSFNGNERTPFRVNF